MTRSSCRDSAARRRSALEAVADLSTRSPDRRRGGPRARRSSGSTRRQGPSAWRWAVLEVVVEVREDGVPEASESPRSVEGRDLVANFHLPRWSA